MKITKAVIPAAGLGTRVLPATKSMPKEMLTIVDKPAIQYIVEEAARAGIEDILIITNRGKVAIEDHFDHSFELETQLEQAKNKPAETIMVSSDKETFKAYYLPAVNAFENMLKFISNSSEKDFCIEKTKNLLEICRKKLGEIT